MERWRSAEEGSVDPNCQPPCSRPNKPAWGPAIKECTANLIQLHQANIIRALLDAGETCGESASSVTIPCRSMIQ